MKVTPFSLPGSYLVLELANGCNLRCTHCAQSDESHPHYRTTGYFPRLEVQKLLADLARHRIRFDALILFWLGEPLLHPEFADIYRDLLDHCLEHDTFGQIELHTNASMLTRKVAARALNRIPVPQRWHLTIDAATPETYLAIKGSDLLPRVEENVERIAGFRGRGGFPFPQLVLQYIVSDRNELEVDPFISRWKAVFDRHRLSLETTAFHVPHDFRRNYLFLKSLDCPTADEQARQNGVYRRVIERLELAPPFNPDEVVKVKAGAEVIARELDVPCSGFWKSPVIGWDGMLTTCTRDSLGENALGTVFETPFSELWFGEGRIAAWRREVGRGDYSSLPLCQSCFIPKSVNYTGITAEEIGQVAREPVQLEKEPVQLVKEAVQLVKEPVQLENEVVQLVKEPVQLVKEPVQLVKEVVQLVREPVQLAKEPVQLEKEPVQLVKEVAQLVKEPVQLEKEPVQLVKEPVQLEKEPVQLEKEPVQLEKEPPLLGGVTNAGYEAFGPTGIEAAPISRHLRLVVSGGGP